MASFRVNLLALVGAIIGVVAIFPTWVSASLFVWSADFNLIDLVNDAENATLLVGCWLFLIGVILAIFTPLGGFLEIIGVALFMTWFVPETDGDLPSNIGSYLGIVAGVIALVSLARPLGPGLMSGPIRLKDRLLVFSSQK